jgi:DNA-binding NarL/FixJ family response regulator
VDFTDDTLTTVLLVSDFVLFRQALAIAIAQEESCLLVSEAADMDDALRLIGSRKPDIVLLHLSVPASPNMRRLKRILEFDPDIAVIVLFDGIDDNLTRAALLAGAAGCLDSSVDVAHLIQGLHAAANGELALSKGIARLMAVMLGRTNGSNDGRTTVVTPTPRELRVLELVSLGMTNRAIAKRLLLSESTVRAHVRSVSQKLGSQNRVQAVARAMSMGMIGSHVEGDDHLALVE